MALFVLGSKLEDITQVVQFDRFGEVGIHKAVGAGGGLILDYISGKGGDKRLLLLEQLGTDALGSFDAAHAWHFEVHQQEIIRAEFDDIDRFDAIAGMIAGVAQFAEDVADNAEVGWIILHDEDAERKVAGEGLPEFVGLLG